MNLFKHIFSYRYVISSDDDNGALFYQKNALNDNSLNTASSLNEITGVIKKRRQHVLTATLALSLAFTILACTLTALFVSPFAVILAFVPAMVTGFVTGDYIFEKKAFFIRLRYNLNTQDSTSFHSLTDRVTELMRSENVWHVHSVTRNYDKKQHGASAELYERIPLRRYRSRPAWLVTAADIPALRQGAMVIYFFPDFLLIKQQNSITALPYGELLVQYREKAFIEYEFMPQDARIIRTTWLHPNKDDGPDRRFKKNIQIPVMLYSEIALSAYTGLQIRLLISNTALARNFSALLGKKSRHYEEHLAEEEPHRKKDVHKKAGSHYSSTAERDQYYWEQRNNAYGRKKSRYKGYGKQKIKEKSSISQSPHHVLGVPLDASEDEVKSAYRFLAKKFHPDRFASKGLKETALANEMFKKITAAYEMIKKKRRV